jgi:hypothetical protein
MHHDYPTVSCWPFMHPFVGGRRCHFLRCTEDGYVPGLMWLRVCPTLSDSFSLILTSATCAVSNFRCDSQFLTCGCVNVSIFFDEEQTHVLTWLMKMIICLFSIVNMWSFFKTLYLVYSLCQWCVLRSKSGIVC